MPAETPRITTARNAARTPERLWNILIVIILYDANLFLVIENIFVPQYFTKFLHPMTSLHFKSRAIAIIG